MIKRCLIFFGLLILLMLIFLNLDLIFSLSIKYPLINENLHDYDYKNNSLPFTTSTDNGNGNLLVVAGEKVGILSMPNVNRKLHLLIGIISKASSFDRRKNVNYTIYI